ncbi:MAG: hypothetical protein ACOCRX_06250 [Candidatus Woesearchaeota archaeon]
MTNENKNEVQNVDVEQAKVMLDKNGNRIHKMNINMKNRIFAKFQFEELGEKLKKTKDIIGKDFKYYDRMLNELNKYNINGKNEIVQRPKYYLVETKKGNLYLIKNEGDNVQYISVEV